MKPINQKALQLQYRQLQLEQLQGHDWSEVLNVVEEHFRQQEAARAQGVSALIKAGELE